MPLTPNFSIYYRDTSTPASLETESALQADSVDDALTLAITGNRQIQTFRWANAAARTAQTGMVAGDTGYQTDTAMEYIYTGSAWRVNTGGLVLLESGTFTTASSITSDPFSSAFDGYLIRLRADFSTAAFISAVFRASGSDLTDANYDRQILQGSASTAAAAEATGQTAMSSLTMASRNRASASINIFSARSARATMLEADITAHGGGSTVRGTYGGVYTPTTAIDGIKFTTNTGTATGAYSVYGYVR